MECVSNDDLKLTMVDIRLRGRVAYGADFVPEHARVAPLMTTGVNQFPLFTLIERHLTAWT